METEMQILMEQNKRQGERLDNITNQLDQDRKDIDLLRIDQATIKESQKTIIETMTDFKKDVRQIVIDTINTELPKVVKKAISKELTSISLKNPRKVIERRYNFFESVKLLFTSKHDHRQVGRA